MTFLFEKATKVYSRFKLQLKRANFVSNADTICAQAIMTLILTDILHYRSITTAALYCDNSGVATKDRYSFHYY